ncbi:hypothetical protein MMC30_004897 [Trapelia coarctata]|nr:hypothetical protein [Trapelia coarctata]
MSSQKALQQAPQLPALTNTLGVIPAYYAEGCTTLVMKGKMSWSGDDYTIKNVEGTPFLKIKGVSFSMSSRCEVLDNEGQPLFTVRKELFSFLPTFYAEDPQGNRFLDVSGEFSFGKKKSTITFLNAVDDFLQLAWGSSIAAVVIIESRSPALTSSESSATPPPKSADAGAPASPSARPSSRRNLITQQIYQFALGYPQTPPENSPVSDPFESVLGSEETKVEKDKMGTFLFKWDHPATEVYVTGTFDAWAKSVKLEKKEGNLHEKLVELPHADEKIYYKFFVDNRWTTDHTAPQETDSANNTNNVLLPENITKSHSSAHDPASVLMSGVTPQSTTSGLAGNVPKEMERAGSSDLPGSFPETPAVEAAGFNVGSGSKDADNSQQTFGVAPLPATSGIGNPIHTQPGEKVPDPSTFTNNTIASAVTTDKDSYEKSGGPPQLPNVVTPQKERDARGGMFGMLPDSLKNLIPESSLPMGGKSAEKDPGYTIQSAGPQSTTAELAGQVPLESDGSRNVTSTVPDIVQESQAKAGFEPEASANKEAVIEKSEVEKELESKVPEEPATAEGTNHANGGTTEKKEFSNGNVAGMVAGAAGATAAVAAAAGYAVHEKAKEAATSLPTHVLPPSVQQSIDEMNKGTAIDPHVPDMVQESITKAHVAPEAAASSDMVQEKSAMESELLKKVPEEDSTGKPAPALASALSGTAPAPTTESASPSAAAAVSEIPPAAPAKDIAPTTEAAAPAPISKDVEPPPTAASPAPALMKSTENPLPMKSTETPLPAAGLAAPATAPAMTEASKPGIDSRDVSPMTRPAGTSSQQEPIVTTGVGSSTAPATSAPTTSAVADSTPVASSSAATTPQNAAAAPSSPVSAKTGESSASGEQKKRNRASGFFGKLKSRFEHKDKDKK